MSGNRVYFFSEDGKTTVIEAGPAFKVLAENQLGDGFMASPAAADGALFLRSRTRLYRIGDYGQPASALQVIDDITLRLIVGALAGAAVGLERQRSGKAAGPAARFGGLRTFTLIGLAGALGGWLWTLGVTIPAGVVVVAAAAMIVAAYVASSRVDVDATTEVAALVVLATGVVAGLDRLALAGGLAVATTLLLAEKSRLHALVAAIDGEGFRAGLRFAAMALVVLPLVPEGPFGTLGGGIRPRGLWLLVLVFSGLSFAGYVARTAVSPRYGDLPDGAPRRPRLVDRRHADLRARQPGASGGWREPRAGRARRLHGAGAAHPDCRRAPGTAARGAARADPGGAFRRRRPPPRLPASGGAPRPW